VGFDHFDLMFLYQEASMDKDMSQIEHNSTLHNKNSSEISTQQQVSNRTVSELPDQEAEMDALESRLFAMARSRC
jgi:hypothetical protein